jgi:hypothetical protein
MPASVDDSRAPAPADRDDRGARLEVAARWLETELAGQPAPPLLVVIGLGDGDLLDVLDQRAPATKVLALEPDAAIATRFLQRVDVQRRRETGRLVYLADPDYAGADQAWRVFPPVPDHHKMIASPAVARDGGPGAVRAARAFKQILFGVRANAEARRRFAPGYLAGTLYNLPEIVAGNDIRALTDVYRGMPAVIAAAGPSLDAVLDDLDAVRDRAVFIAADTALRPLLTRGLAPEFVVAVDPQATNARHFHSLPDCSKTWLVSEASIDPSVVRPFGRRTFWFRVSEHEPWSWYREAGIDVGQIDVWGSVLTAAFQVAVLAGCDPIVMVGADLSFTGGRPYCRGTTYEFDWAHVIADGRGMEQAWRPFLKPDDQIRVPDCYGAETITTGAMQSFRDWMVARARRSGRRVVNATGAGILFGEGIALQSVRDALPAPCAIASPRAIARKAPSSTPGAELARRLWDVHRTVCRNAQATPPLDRWKAFCGDGFNLEAVGSAIERAARALERTEAGSSPDGTVIPWTRLAASGEARRVARRLPEGIVRWRAALGGAEPGPAAADVDRVALAGEAFEILRAICSATTHANDLALPVPAGHPGRLSLSALPTWPVDMAWAVRLFEACLGHAWTRALPVPPAEPSFFSRHVTPRDRPAELSARDANSVARPHIEQASALLALEWLPCALQHGARSDAEFGRAIGWWRQLVATVGSPKQTTVGGAPTTLVLEAGTSDLIEVPLPGGDAALARVLTGALREGDEPIGLGRLDAGGKSAALQVRLRRTASGDRDDRRPVAPLIRPRVLTDEGAARAVFAYGAVAGAVCVGLHRHASVLVREDGSIEPHHAWPRPINGELPFGDAGAVAWGVGKAAWPDGGPGYVMFRSAPDEKPTIEELPFGPTAGVWQNDRMYWTCFPFGVGTWAPNEAPTFSLPDITLYAVHPDDAGFVLHPRVRGATGVTERRLPGHGWRWRPGQPPEAMPLGPFGPASSRSVSGDWTAVTHPEADLVRLESTAGPALSMICYYPFSVAWAGRSLLVCTNDGEVLLFDRLLDVLEGWSRR